MDATFLFRGQIRLDSDVSRDRVQGATKALGRYGPARSHTWEDGSHLVMFQFEIEAPTYEAAFDRSKGRVGEIVDAIVPSDRRRWERAEIEPATIT